METGKVQNIGHYNISQLAEAISLKFGTLIQLTILNILEKKNLTQMRPF